MSIAKINELPRNALINMKGDLNRTSDAFPNINNIDKSRTTNNRSRSSTRPTAIKVDRNRAVSNTAKMSPQYKSFFDLTAYGSPALFVSPIYDPVPSSNKIGSTRPSTTQGLNRPSTGGLRPQTTAAYSSAASTSDSLSLDAGSWFEGSLDAGSGVVLPPPTYGGDQDSLLGEDSLFGSSFLSSFADMVAGPAAGSPPRSKKGIQFAKSLVGSDPTPKHKAVGRGSPVLFKLAYPYVNFSMEGLGGDTEGAVARNTRKKKKKKKKKKAQSSATVAATVESVDAAAIASQPAYDTSACDRERAARDRIVRITAHRRRQEEAVESLMQVRRGETRREKKTLKEPFELLPIRLVLSSI